MKNYHVFRREFKITVNKDKIKSKNQITESSSIQSISQSVYNHLFQM